MIKARDVSYRSNGNLSLRGLGEWHSTRETAVLLSYGLPGASQVQVPTKFEMAINVTGNKTLGAIVPRRSWFVTRR
jgi:hypothetical protein